MRAYVCLLSFTRVHAFFLGGGRLAGTDDGMAAIVGGTKRVSVTLSDLVRKVKADDDLDNTLIDLSVLGLSKDQVGASLCACARVCVCTYLRSTGICSIRRLRLMYDRV